MSSNAVKILRRLLLGTAAIVLTVLSIGGCSPEDFMEDSPNVIQGHSYVGPKEGDYFYEIIWEKIGGVTKADVYRLNRGRMAPDGDWDGLTRIKDPDVIKAITALDTDLPPYVVTALTGSAKPGLLAAAATATASPKPYILSDTDLILFDPVTAQPANSLSLTTAPLTGSPSRFKVTSDGAFAVISNENGPNHPYVLLVDLTSFTIVANIDIPENANAYGVAITPDNQFAYVVTQSLATGQDNVYVIDLTSRRIATTIPLPKYGNLDTIVLTPDGTEAYLISAVGGNFQIPVIDTASNTAVLDVPTYYYSKATGILSLNAPCYLAMHPDGSRLYMAPVDGSPVHVLDTATKIVTKRITIPQGATPVASTHPVFTADGRLLFISNGPAAISVISTDDDTLLGTVPVDPTLAAAAPGARKMGLLVAPGQ
jgi:DNA-binding beta-propeller fold protein YncE